ncbi:MAG: hypothetical protein WCQ16_02845 [Verrucomicrobiae bacterium]
MSKYTQENGAILCDGQPVATLDTKRNAIISPAPLHHKIKAAIARIIEGKPTFLVEPVSPMSDLDEPAFLAADEPAMDPGLGDKTPAYIEWYRDNHTAGEFQAKYGHRKFTL